MSSVKINVSESEIERYVPASVKRRRVIIAQIVQEYKKTKITSFAQAKEIARKVSPETSSRVLADYTKTALYLLGKESII